VSSARDDASIDAEIQRVGSLTLPRLGTEIKLRAFGAEGPGGPGKPGTLEAPELPEVRVGLADIAREFAPAYANDAVSTEQRTRLDRILAEGLQLLEHAALVRIGWRGGVDDYTATRLGRATMARGEVERVLEATGR
jgi:hypothetical protein